MVEKICGRCEFWAWNGTENVWWTVTRKAQTHWTGYHSNVVRHKKYRSTCHNYQHKCHISDACIITACQWWCQNRTQ